ncbi:MAG: VanZ family protein [Bifidobacteriaceae bacterium]|jgi:glycopeptide antibiotics resistance protein|nr:VanZ family protein [Bifidobacteriaceae bacterium]
MGGQVLPAILAGLLGVGLALAGFAPFVALTYRRYGRLTVRRAVFSLGLLIYILGIWAYTLLPLPNPAEIRCSGTQLVPFYFLSDMTNYPLDSLGAWLRNPVVLQTGLNVVLFLPLGFLVRALWGKGVGWTVLVGAALSLFVELTQLTGVWGLYPCAYRLFDVDDLISNTSGALLGALLALAVPRRWLSVERLAPGVGAPVTVGRRLVAMLVDAVCYVVVAAPVAIGAQLWQLFVLSRPVDALDSALSSALGFWVAVGLQALSVAVSGRTLGDHATQLALAPARPAWLARRAVRFFAGIGGFQLLALLPDPFSALQGAFALAALVAVVVARRARSLPGAISRQALVDVRAQDTAEAVPAHLQ